MGDILVDSINKSQEWHDKRKSVIGGSDAPIVTGDSPWRSPYDLWLEKSGRQQPKDISGLPFVLRGTLGEEGARLNLEHKLLKAIRPKAWAGEKSWHRAQDDGYCLEENFVIEIKCMSKQKHEDAKNGIIPKNYMVQMQYVLFLSKATKCIFVSYVPETEEMVTIDVLPDPAEQERIISMIDAFWLNHVLKDTPPPRTEKDYVELDKPELNALLDEYEIVDGVYKQAEEKRKELIAKIKPYTATCSHIRSPIGFKLTVSKRDGGIDYKKYVADKGVTEEELKSYKKKDVEAFSITIPGPVRF